MRRTFKLLEDGSAIFEEGCEVRTPHTVVDELEVSELPEEVLEQLRLEPQAFQIERSQQRKPKLSRKPDAV